MNPPIEGICNQMVLWGYEIGVVSTRTTSGFYPSLGLRVRWDSTLIWVPVAKWHLGQRVMAARASWGDIRPLRETDDIEYEQYLALYEHARHLQEVG